MKSFDTKDLKVSNGKFESSHRKHSDDFKLSTGNFESSDTKDSKIDGRSRSRTTKQINSYKKNFSKGHSLQWKLQELDTRLRNLQSLVLSMRLKKSNGSIKVDELYHSLHHHYLLV